MADKKVTDSDEAAKTDAERPPMKEPRVRVNVRPVKHKTGHDVPADQREKSIKQNQENRKLAEKVEENLEKEIKKRVADVGEKPGASREDQYDAAEDAVHEAASQTSRRKINRIDYEVDDEDGYIEDSVTPSEGAPPDDEDD